MLPWIQQKNPEAQNGVVARCLRMEQDSPSHSPVERISDIYNIQRLKVIFTIEAVLLHSWKQYFILNCLSSYTVYFCFNWDGMLVNHRVTPSIWLLVPIYTPGWRDNVCLSIETTWRLRQCLKPTTLRSEKRHAYHYATACSNIILPIAFSLLNLIVNCFIARIHLHWP